MTPSSDLPPIDNFRPPLTDADAFRPYMLASIEEKPCACMARRWTSPSMSMPRPMPDEMSSSLEISIRGGGKGGERVRRGCVCITFTNPKPTDLSERRARATSACAVYGPLILFFHSLRSSTIARVVAFDRLEVGSNNSQARCSGRPTERSLPTEDM